MMKNLAWAVLALLVVGGCSNSSSTKQTSDADTKIDLIGSWTNRDKSKFMEITKTSVVINEKDSADEDIGFYEIDGDTIKIYKDKDTSEGRTEIAKFEMISENEVLFGANQEYWNVVKVTGRWYREGTDIKKVIAEQEYKKLTEEEQHLVDIKKKRKGCEELIKTLEGDRKSYLVKLSNLDEKTQADSWKLNASMLSKTKQRLSDADYELKKLKRAEEALEALIADQQRSKDIKKAGLDDEGLKKILLSIGETESKLPIKDVESEFELKSLVEEELKTLNKKDNDQKSGKK